MKTVTAEQREIASYTAAAFGVEKPPIFHFWDDKKRSDVYVMQAVDRPKYGVTSYATVGLSDHLLVRDGKEFGVRVEILGACSSEVPEFDNVLATVAFCVINSGWFCAPGVIFPDVISMYKHSETMSDIYFAHPFLWEDRLKSARVGSKTVAWLLAVPISKRESEFAQVNGSAKLEALFEEMSIDIFNLNRASVV
jgi:hypothetical protein